MERSVEVIKSDYHLPRLYKRVAIYCRVSSKTAAQLASLSAQVSGLVKMLSTHLNLTLVDTYIDFDSGENSDRPELKRMLSDAGENRFDEVYTKSVSRFGRDTEDTLITVRELKKNHVRVIFCVEGIDSFSPDGEFWISISAAFAQEDNKSRRENQIWAVKKRLEDGTSELYSRVTYGYRKNKDGVIDIDRDQAETVQLIYTEYLKGASILGIQRLLQERGIPSSRGNGIWSKCSIEHVLSNEKYMGDVIARKTIASSFKGHKRIRNETEPRYLYDSGFPVIISREMFEAVQLERKRRSNIVVDESGTHRKSTHYSSKKKGKTDAQ